MGRGDRYGRQDHRLQVIRVVELKYSRTLGDQVFGFVLMYMNRMTLSTEAFDDSHTSCRHG